jgi:hypothetical protein
MRARDTVVLSPSRLVLLLVTLAAACSDPAAPVVVQPTSLPGATNAAPTVTVGLDGAGTCTVKPGAPCSLTFVATGTDPDGDPLTYAWSGCASGAAGRATCAVDRAGSVTASVTVSDGRGHTASASASGEGIVGPNRPPDVVLSFERGSSCRPEPRTPCTIGVVAEATDPDGDPLRFYWSGCASGDGPRAVCRIERPGAIDVSLEVKDDHDNAARRTIVASGEGTNRPPGVQIGYLVTFPNAPNSFELLGNVIDPDEGFLCGRQYCDGATAAGACQSASLSCTCLAGLEVQVVRSAPTGTCSVTLSLRDSWGQLGTATIAFDVANPRAPSGTTPGVSPATTLRR